jgi:hypothetical protein
MTGKDDQTVQDGQGEPLEDGREQPSPKPFEYRIRPTSPSPRLHQSLAAQGVDRFQDPSCDTTVCHTVSPEPSQNRYPARLSDDPGCSTAACHNVLGPSSRLPLPSRRSQPPSAPRFRRQPSGLIIRGRVFYLRLRVPGGLVEKVGRTHWARSLGTGSCFVQLCVGSASDTTLRRSSRWPKALPIQLR